MLACLHSAACTVCPPPWWPPAAPRTRPLPWTQPCGRPAFAQPAGRAEPAHPAARPSAAARRPSRRCTWATARSGPRPTCATLRCWKRPRSSAATSPPSRPRSRATTRSSTVRQRGQPAGAAWRGAWGGRAGRASAAQAGRALGLRGLRAAKHGSSDTGTVTGIHIQPPARLAPCARWCVAHGLHAASPGWAPKRTPSVCCHAGPPPHALSKCECCPLLWCLGALVPWIDVRAAFLATLPVVANGNLPRVWDQVGGWAAGLSQRRYAC